MKRSLHPIAAIVLTCFGCAHAPRSGEPDAAARAAGSQSSASTPTNAQGPVSEDKAVPEKAVPENAGEEPALGGMGREYGWISVGVGATAALVGLGTSYVMLHNKSVRDDNCDAQKVCSQAGFDANSQMNAISGVNTGAWVVAAAGLGLGAILVLSNPPDHRGQTVVGVAPSTSGAAVTLRSSF